MALRAACSGYLERRNAGEICGTSSKLFVTIAKPTGAPACQPTILMMRGLASSASTSSRE